jgi:hypothetical protein
MLKCVHGHQFQFVRLNAFKCWVGVLRSEMRERESSPAPSEMFVMDVVMTLELKIIIKRSVLLLCQNDEAKFALRKASKQKLMI